MLTTNIDIADTTVYGQMETVVKIYLDRITQKPTVVYISVRCIELIDFTSKASHHSRRNQQELCQGRS